MEQATTSTYTIDAPGSSPSTSMTPSPALLNMNDFSLDMTSPAPDTLLLPQSSAAKQPKKRKSWGQALPEPKTSLPPRKRAKTEDEKEQRRIERIKRNRAAAHNSRERKRVEAERLEVENHHLKHRLAMMQQHLLRQSARLQEYQRLVPNALPTLSAEDFAAVNFEIPEMKVDAYPDTPASSIDTIDPRASLSASSPGNDAHTPFIKAESPCTSVIMPTPSVPASEYLDQTRHSAAMLCDLQCRSSQTLANAWWARMMLCLMHTNIMTCYKTLLALSCHLWPAYMARAMETISPSTTSSTTCSTRTSSRTTRRRATPATTTATTSTIQRLQRVRTAPSATSTTPSLLLSFLSQLLQSQTSAQSFLAKGLSQEDASAARLALLSRLGQQAEVVVDGELEGLVLHSSRGRRSWRSSDKDGGNGKHDDGGIG